MKTRIIQTRFWNDEFINDAEPHIKFVYLYFLTTPDINISGIFQLPKSKICFQTGFTKEQVEEALNVLEQQGKVIFRNGWVYIRKALANNKYINSPDNKKAFFKEIADAPQELVDILKEDYKEVFIIDITPTQQEQHTTVNTTVDSSYNSELITNNKERGKGGMGEKPKQPETSKPLPRTPKLQPNTEISEIAMRILEKSNSVWQRKETSSIGWQDNLQYWLQFHSEQEILQVIEKAKNVKWWKEAFKLTLLLRTRNPKGEKVDYINDILISPLEKAIETVPTSPKTLEILNRQTDNFLNRYGSAKSEWTEEGAKYVEEQKRRAREALERASRGKGGG